MSNRFGIVNGKGRLITYPREVINIRGRYPYLDAADAVQVAAISQSFLRFFIDESKPQLVTADGKLKQAAEAEKKSIKVVYVNQD